MSGILRAILFLYDLILLVLGGIVAAVAFGRAEPMKYLDMVLATTQNRIILGSAGIILIVLAVVVLIPLFKGQPRDESIVIENALAGQISMTVPAAKVIIHRAVQKIDGVKETKTAVKNPAEGLTIYIHMMINPELSVPELSKQIQDIVKEDMLHIGGLEVHAVKVLIDDFGTTGKSTAK